MRNELSESMIAKYKIAREKKSFLCIMVEQHERTENKTLIFYYLLYLGSAKQFTVIIFEKLYTHFSHYSLIY